MKGIPLCFHLTGDQKCCEAVSAAWWTCNGPRSSLASNGFKSAGVHGELALVLSGGRNTECFLLSILLENPADISSASDHLVRVGRSARAPRRPATFADQCERSLINWISARIGSSLSCKVPFWHQSTANSILQNNTTDNIICVR